MFSFQLSEGEVNMVLVNLHGLLTKSGCDAKLRI